MDGVHRKGIFRRISSVGYWFRNRPRRVSARVVIAFTMWSTGDTWREMEGIDGDADDDDDDSAGTK